MNRLNGSLPRISSALRSTRLQFAGHCFRRVEEPIHSILFFKAAGTFRPGGNARVSYVKTLLVDKPSLNCLKSLHHELSGVIYASWLGSTSTLPLSRRRRAKKERRTLDYISRWAGLTFTVNCLTSHLL